MAYYPPNGDYTQLNMTEDVYLDYPYSADVSKTTVTDIMDINALNPNLSIILPDSTETGPGFSIAFNNVGNTPVDILLNDGVTGLLSMGVGAAVTIYLTKNNDANGLWRIMAFGNGVPAISNFSIDSPNDSINITNGTITNPGGTVSIDVSTLINKLNVLSTSAAGIVVYNDQETDPWYITLLAGGSNLNVTNGDGAIAGNPIAINLDNNIEVDSVTSGNVNITNNQITNVAENADLMIDTTGVSAIVLNGVRIDNNGNITNITSLNATTSFIAPNITRAWCRFTNTSGTLVLTSSYNVSSISYDSLTYQYTINFTNPMGASEYGVFISCANNNSTPPLQTRVGYDVVRTDEYVNIVLADLSGEMLADFPEGVSVMIYSLT